MPSYAPAPEVAGVTRDDGIHSIEPILKGEESLYYDPTRRAAIQKKMKNIGAIVYTNRTGYTKNSTTANVHLDTRSNAPLQ